MYLLSRIFDSVVGNLAKNFAEGTEYFKVMNDLIPRLPLRVEGGSGYETR